LSPEKRKGTNFIMSIVKTSATKAGEQKKQTQKGGTAGKKKWKIQSFE
jgi:hypothetical protein